MKMKGMLTTGMLIMAGMAHGALPPYYQSEREIKSLLENAKVLKLFTTGRSIESIVKAGNGYDISSGDCTLHVQVKYLPLRHVVGPADYELVVPDHIACQ